jgi:uncharacterized protein (UPF0210 family)
MNVASTRAGINMDAVLLMGRKTKKAAAITADRDGLACAKLCVFANIPQDVPFMAGAYLGVGEAEAVINVGVSGPAWSAKPSTECWRINPELNLGQITEMIKRTAYKVTRVGELIGREVATSYGHSIRGRGSLPGPHPQCGRQCWRDIPKPRVCDSIGVPGTTAALAMLNDAVKKGGAFASSHVGGLSGAFIPVSEDLNISQSAEEGYLTIEKLEAMTSVCSVGLDMVAIPGETTAEETLSAIIADEMAIGVINKKTTAARIIPVPGKKAGDHAYFGGLLGESTIMAVNNATGSNRFLRRGGLIPSPIHSLVN